MYTVAITIQPYINRMMALCGAVTVIAAFTYGFLLLEAVGHTAERSAAEQEIRHLTSELSMLEARYLSQTREVTPELASALGFVKPIETSVVYAEASTLSLNAGQ